MKPLTNDQMEEIEEIYKWGYFMEHVLKYRTDMSSNNLSEEDILLLIEAENNLDMFSDYEFESEPCKTCGSHGEVSVKIDNKRVVIKEW